jgi:hypothetical protein
MNEADMLVLLQDAALDPAEWQDWLASTGRFELRDRA